MAGEGGGATGIAGRRASTRPAPRLDALARPPGGDRAALLVALVAVSTSGPLIAATAAPALAIAFWRNALAAGLLLPAAATRCRAELRRLTRREWLLALAAGGLLAAHFGTWVPSLRYTSVASATALVASQPVWAGLLARAGGQRVSGLAWAGIGVAVTGAVLLTGVDVSFSPRSAVGDALAVAGGVFAAGYMVVGGEVRRSVSTTAYTTVCYSTTALVLGAACWFGDQRLSGYPSGAWLRLLALTVGAQLLGHSLFNRVLKTTSATVVSLLILFEVPGAALIAVIFLGQRPPAAALPAAALLVAGVAMVVRAGGSVNRPSAVPAE